MRNQLSGNRTSKTLSVCKDLQTNPDDFHSPDIIWNDINWRLQFLNLCLFKNTRQSISSTPVYIFSWSTASFVHQRVFVWVTWLLMLATLRHCRHIFTFLLKFLPQYSPYWLHMQQTCCHSNSADEGQSVYRTQGYLEIWSLRYPWFTSANYFDLHIISQCDGHRKARHEIKVSCFKMRKACCCFYNIR